MRLLINNNCCWWITSCCWWLLSVVVGLLAVVDGLLTVVDGLITVVHGLLADVDRLLGVVDELLAVVNRLLTIVDGWLVLLLSKIILGGTATLTIWLCEIYSRYKFKAVISQTMVLQMLRPHWQRSQAWERDEEIVSLKPEPTSQHSRHSLAMGGYIKCCCNGPCQGSVQTESGWIQRVMLCSSIVWHKHVHLHWQKVDLTF